jgi:FAD/FMN-containing dehydrogenase
MNQLIDIDEESGLARVQAGALGPDLEDQLSARGWVLGHYPDSFIHSTLGGWVATRSSGMQSDKYGDISDIACGVRVVMPDKVLVVRPVPQLYAELGVRGWIMCHLSHSYHSGACLYFTFGFKHDGVDPLGQYEPLKNAIQQAFVDSGGTLSHHHAVGTEHARWLEQAISAPGVHMIDGLFTAMDPGRNFNPGKIIAK